MLVRVVMLNPVGETEEFFKGEYGDVFDFSDVLNDCFDPYELTDSVLSELDEDEASVIRDIRGCIQDEDDLYAVYADVTPCGVSYFGLIQVDEDEA
jgi:hypothetical protein